MQLNSITSVLVLTFFTPLLYAAETEQMEIIEVYGTKGEKSLYELTGSASVISEQDIQRSIATQLSDLFKSEPGVSITGYSGRPQNITIRGMTGNRVLIIQDGARAADGYGAADINDLVGRFNFDLEDVSSIEVAKGPASAFFGSGALAGVVKINTKQASDYLGNQKYYLLGKALYSGVNEESKQSIVAATNIMDSLPIVIKFSNWTAKEQQNYSENRVPLDVEGQSARLNTQWLADTGTLTYNLDWITQETANQYAPTSIPQPDGAWLVENQQQLETQESINNMLTWQANVSAPWFDDFTGQAFWRKTEHENKTNQLLSRIVLEVQNRYRQILSKDLFEQNTYGLSVDFAKYINHHEFIYGFSFEELEHQRPKQDVIIENGEQKTAETAPFKPAKTQIMGVYLGDDIELFDNWQLLLGLRFDQNKLSTSDENYNDNSSNKLTSSANLVYQNSNGIKSYLAYAQGYRAAPYDKVYGSIPHLFAFPPFEIVPNSELEAETSDSIELGFSWGKTQFKIASSIYYTRYDDFIDWQNIRLRLDDGVVERQFVNIDAAYTYGAELELDYQLNSNFDINMNIGWMNGKNKQKDEALRSLVPLEYALTANYQWQDLALSAQLYGQQSMSKVPECQAPFLGHIGDCHTSKSWWVADAQAEYQITENFIVNLALNNLFDKQFTRYQDIAGLAPTERDYSQPGRNFIASIRYTF